MIGVAQCCKTNGFRHHNTGFQYKENMFPTVVQLIPFLLFTSTFLPVLGIQCYRCLPKAVPNTNNQTTSLEPCSQFDGSSKFVIDCPLSTFCMKRNFTLEFPDGRNAIVTERGCAQQSFSYRVLKRGQWQTINDVNETIYQDGCILEHQGTKPPTQYCYCSSRMCNAASTVQSNLLICFFLLLVYYIF